jgi:dTDP-4-amino-4,6-dideoxygalactose transaminase
LKQGLDDLAVFGGKSAFSTLLHVGSPNTIDLEAYIARIREVYQANWLTNNGQFVQELESRTARYFGIKHCIAVSSGTTGLEIAIRSTGLKGQVIVPSFTFVATAHALHWLGIEPVFCDIDPDTHSIDPAKVIELITPETTGIIGVHTWGSVCRILELEEISEKHGLILLFDAAHAFGSRDGHGMAGGFGKAEVFSLHATKFINSAEGGLITTNDDELAEKMRLMRNFGFAGYDRIVSVGINGKMSELAAAAGVTALDSLDRFLDHNRANYSCYADLLSGIAGLSIHQVDALKSNCQYIVVEIDDALTGIHRDMVMDVLWKENVLARRYFYPGCHRSEPYMSIYPDSSERLRETESLCDRVLCLPTGTSIDKETIGGICNLVRFIIENGDAISSRIRSQT